MKAEFGLLEQLLEQKESQFRAEIYAFGAKIQCFGAVTYCSGAKEEVYIQVGTFRNLAFIMHYTKIKVFLQLARPFFFII